MLSQVEHTSGRQTLNPTSHFGRPLNCLSNLGRLSRHTLFEALIQLLSIPDIKLIDRGVIRQDFMKVVHKCLEKAYYKLPEAHMVRFHTPPFLFSSQQTNVTLPRYWGLFC